MFRFLLVATFLVALGGTVLADTIILNNGGRLHGRIESEDDEKVVINIGGSGTMTIRRSKIKEIRRDGFGRNMGPAERERTREPESQPVKPEPSSQPETPDRKEAGKNPWQDQNRPSGDTSAERMLSAELEGVEINNVSVFEAVKILEKATGLKFVITEEGKKCLEKENEKVSRGYMSETLGDILHNVVRWGSNMKMSFEAVDNSIIIGLKREVCGPKARETSAGIAWDDEAGDRRSDPSGWKYPDITRLEMEGSDGNLKITLTFASYIMPILNQRTAKGTVKGYMLVDLYLDTDNNSDTGSAPSWDRVRTGFEERITLETGFEFTDSSGNQMTQSGNIESIAGVHTVKRVLIDYDYWKAGSNTTYRPKNEKADGKSREDRISVDGAKVTFTIPYSHFELKSGDKIRALYIDEVEDLGSDHRMSRDGTLTLK